MLKQKQSGGNYLSIIGGTLRKNVAENTPGAIRRDYEDSKGNKGTKFELVYTSLSGVIKSVGFYEGDFGKSLSLRLEDGQDTYTLSVGVEQPYAEDLMKKLPAIDLSKEIEITPYDFEDDKGKRRRGVTVKQNGNKVENHFWDTEKKLPKNGYPVVEDTSMDKEDWKMYFMQARKFMIKFITENIVPKFDKFEELSKSSPLAKLMDDEIDESNIPF